MASKQWPHEQLEPSFFSFTFHRFLLCYLLITIIVVLKLARAKIKANLNLPPSPPKLPIIGNLHQLGTFPYHSFRALSHKYGALMMLKLGKTQAIVVSSADVAKEIVTTNDITFSDRHKITAVKTMLYGGNDIGFGSYGERWKQKRKICVLELLNHKRVQSFSHIKEKEVAQMVNKIHEATLNGAPSVNLSELLIETANNIICKCALGQNHNLEDCYMKVKEISRKMMILLTVNTLGDHFPFLGWVDVLTGKIKQFKATFGALDALFDQVIAEHKRMKRETDNPSTEKDFVDILIQVQEGGMPGFELTNEDIKSILLDMFTAGSDPTATTLEWAMAELMRNSLKLEKAQEEVRKFVGHKSKVEENDINQMDYVKCVVKETLRLHPPAPFLIPRETSSNVKLRGYDIPAKTMVYVNAWAIQRDPQLWERPEEFIPERYDSNHVPFKGQDLHFIPFGFGRRACPGMTFGLASLEYILVNLLCWFNWKLPETYTCGQDIDMSETYGLITSKKVPLHLKPIPLSSQTNF
ncbi:cytochrome P450 71A1-like [Abrus precatorius]|uniref:Cytochrome P450 71A1-like n=1 Tax=Abrus precatorius TaxID=3816 RepID=A0A8B8KUM5_ABRPR|nr:cytochrome P450 71A1-like [Abrus precatorius]